MLRQHWSFRSALLLYEAGSPTQVVRTLGCILVGGLEMPENHPVF